ncbi:hypothetical protein XENTR_v10016061 [Xenopus tropicalis]|nr:hypothetical protein XENTR_v10016061 [Xenopus tropicalis]
MHTYVIASGGMRATRQEERTSREKVHGEGKCTIHSSKKKKEKVCWINFTRMCAELNVQDVVYLYLHLTMAEYWLSQADPTQGHH